MCNINIALYNKMSRDYNQLELDKLIYFLTKVKVNDL
jgi:hypothetical protein